MSRPVLIALLATVGLAVMWMGVLRPKADESGDAPLPPPPATTQPAAAKAPPAAKPAPKVALPAATPARRDAKAPPRGSSAAKAPRTPADAVARDLAAGRSVVILFAGDGADDRAARRAVRSLSGRRVRVRVASLADIPAYGALAAGAKIEGSPTTLVIGPDRSARKIVGLTEPGELRSALAAVSR